MKRHIGGPYIPFTFTEKIRTITAICQLLKDKTTVDRLKNAHDQEKAA